MRLHSSDQFQTLQCLVRKTYGLQSRIRLSRLYPVITTPKQTIPRRNASAGIWTHQYPASAADSPSEYPVIAENRSLSALHAISRKPAHIERVFVTKRILERYFGCPVNGLVCYPLRHEYRKRRGTTKVGAGSVR